MRRIIALLVLPGVLTGMLTGLAACGSSPPTRFFVLEKEPGPLVAAGGGPVALDAVHLPAVLDRLAIVRRMPGDRLDVSGQDRWGGPLDQMSRQVLSQDLAARLPAGFVVAPQGPRPTRQIVVDASEFSADASGRVTLDAQWTLLSGAKETVVLRRRERIETEAAAGDASALASPMSQALGRLADRIAATLAALPAS